VGSRALHLGSGLIALSVAAVLALGQPPPSVGAALDGTAPAQASSPPTSPADRDLAADPFRDREDQLAVLLGRSRVEAGLLPLARSDALDRAAVEHAQDMAARGYMEHEAPDGSTPGSRAAQEGYDTGSGGAWMVVEAISARSDAPNGALDWWLSDSLHRRVSLTRHVA
jgi:uncharacterized protein YkwD